MDLEVGDGFGTVGLIYNLGMNFELGDGFVTGG